jgi:hypothetical protein
MGKKWYTSKTLWVNVLATLGLVLQNATGFQVDGETQVGILAVLNLILRAVTKEGLTA